MNPKVKAAIASYARALIAAALPVWVATHDYKATLNALWAAAIPVLMRWANPQDATYGRVNNDKP